MKSLAIASTALMLGVALTFADPAFRMTYPHGVPRAELAGDYSLSHYTVWRAGAAEGPWAMISDGDVLCTGECFAHDFGAEPGRTYWYRFDLRMPDNSFRSYGPFAARISPELARPIAASVSPNPSRGPARVTLTLAGDPRSAPVQAEAGIFDLQGRRVTQLLKGPVVNGSTVLSWNGRADDGRELGAGIYLLRFGTADGRRSVARLIRIR